jgi:hypothetical protein
VMVGSGDFWSRLFECSARDATLKGVDASGNLGNLKDYG